MFIRFFLLLFLFSLNTNLGYGQETVNHYLLGQQYFTEKKYDTAYDEFFEAFINDPGNLEISFLLGRSAFESGRYEEAIMAYDRILMTTPDAPRVKLELARTHLRLGSRELAKQYFREVLATNPPEQVWKNIEAFLASIEKADKKHFFNGTFSIGYSHDDNIRLAPTSDIISMGLYEITLTGPTATPQTDNVYNTTLVLNHVYKNEEYPFTWKSSAISYNTFYENQNDLDINYLSIATGPVFQKEKFLWDLMATGTNIDVEYDRYQSSFGLSSSLTRVFTTNIFATAAVKFERKNNYVSPDRDASNFSYSLSPVFVFGKNRFSLSLNKEYEIAYDEINSYDRQSWNFRYDRNLPQDFSIFASNGFTNTRYDNENVLFGVNRSDRVQDLAIGGSKLLWEKPGKGQALIAQLSHSYSHSKSNIDLYTYYKNVTALALTLSF
jgi:tetratricopeptide (TPR) repeat protein